VSVDTRAVDKQGRQVGTGYTKQLTLPKGG
jgi:hypothetical protein